MVEDFAGHQQVTKCLLNRDAPLEEALLERCRFLWNGRNLSPGTTSRTGKCVGWSVVDAGADHRPADASRVLNDTTMSNVVHFHDLDHSAASVQR